VNASLISLVPQLVGLCLYFALICALYRQGLTNLGGVACVVGLLGYFKILLKSGAISIAHLHNADPNELARSTSAEFLKAIGFILCGIAAALVLKTAVKRSLMPDDLATVAVAVMVMLFFGLCISLCLLRAITAIVYGRKT
jgi:hypothetical protein